MNRFVQNLAGCTSLLCGSILLLAAPVNAETGTIMLRTGQEPAAVCAAPDGTVSVSLQLDDLSTAVKGVQVAFEYDQSILVLDPEASSESANWTLIALQDTGGSVLYALINLENSVGPIQDAPITIATLVFNVAAPGSTEITLQETNSAITTADPDPVVINGPDLTRIDSGFISVDSAAASNNSPVCTGATIQLTGSVPNNDANPPYSFSWTGPEGFTSDVQNPSIPNASASMAGVYTLTVTNGHGCMHEAQTTVSIQIAPEPSISADPAETVCAGTSVTLDAGDGYAAYSWSPTNESTRTIVVTSPGIYSVTVTGSNGCQGTDSIEVSHLPNPTPTITASPDGPYCDGNTVTLDAGDGYSTYLWSPGGQTSRMIEVVSSDLYSVTVTDANGCTGVDDIEITVNENPNVAIQATPATLDCIGTPVILNAGAGFISYLWSPGGETTPTINVTTPGVYSVTVTNESGCSDSDSITISSDSGPAIEIIASPGIEACAGTPITLSVPEGYASYLWTPGGETDASIIVTQSGSYSVIVTDQEGCQGTDSIEITFHSLPIASAGPDQSACANDADLIIGALPTANGGTAPYNYLWTGTGAAYLDDVTIANPQFDVSAAPVGEYQVCVTVTDANTCQSSTNCAIIRRERCVSIDLTVEGLAGNPNTPGGPYGSPGSTTLLRNVEFVLTDCVPEDIDARTLPVTFTPADTNGFASVQLAGVHEGATWLSVREGHTLRSLVEIDVSSGLDVVSVTLKAGDVQTANVPQDGLIDIVDFSILASRWNMPIDASLSTGADVNGDGVQNTGDFSAMQVNYFDTGAAIDGCGADIVDEPLPLDPMASPKSGKSRITVTALSLIAPDAVAADFTRDGVVDARDIREFAAKNRLKLRPEFEARLEKPIQKPGRSAARLAP